jgi:hypothetical protein
MDIDQLRVPAANGFFPKAVCFYSMQFSNAGIRAMK